VAAIAGPVRAGRGADTKAGMAEIGSAGPHGASLRSKHMNGGDSRRGLRGSQSFRFYGTFSYSP
jgi:hypothetical protein